MTPRSTLLMQSARPLYWIMLAAAEALRGAVEGRGVSAVVPGKPAAAGGTVMPTGAIADAGAGTRNIFGFIDGTARPCCRPLM